MHLSERIKVKVKLLSRVRLFATPVDCSLPGSSIHAIFQARRLEWVAISFSRGSGFPDPGIKPASLTSPALAGRFFNTGPSGKHIIAHLVLVKSYLSRRDICSPISHPWKQLSWGSPWLLWIHLELLNVACGVLCLVAQSCLTLCNPMDYGSPGSSVHGESPGKNTGVSCHALPQGIFPTQGSKAQVSCIAGRFFTS